MTDSLPDFILAGLYPQSLVIVNENTGGNKTGDKGTDLTISGNKNIVPEKQPENVKYWLGDNARHILLIVKDPDHVYISDGNLDFLGKILAACHFNLSDVALVNIARTAIHFDQLSATLLPQYVILFQAQLSDVGLRNGLKPYQPDRREGCTYLQAASLSQMNNGTPAAKQEKQRFWISLKQVFGMG